MAKERDIAEVIGTIRVNLQYQAEYLRRLDQDVSEAAARKLDRVRADLKKLAESTSAQ